MSHASVLTENVKPNPKPLDWKPKHRKQSINVTRSSLDDDDDMYIKDVETGRTQRGLMIIRIGRRATDHQKDE